MSADIDPEDVDFGNSAGIADYHDDDDDDAGGLQMPSKYTCYWAFSCCSMAYVDASHAASSKYSSCFNIPVTGCTCFCRRLRGDMSDMGREYSGRRTSVSSAFGHGSFSSDGDYRSLHAMTQQVESDCSKIILGRLYGLSSQRRPCRVQYATDGSERSCGVQ